MNNFRHLKNVLNYNIKKIDECPAIFCENPDKDFTRDRLLAFETTVRNVICMGLGSLKEELLQLYFHSLETPTTSTFVQDRDKIRDDDATLLRKSRTHKPYSAFHITASYDLLECTYEDMIIQGEAKMDENDAFCQLVDRYKGKKSIYIADRFFESYNRFEHVVKSGNKYLIRVKNIKSKTSITRSLASYPEDEFDIDVFRMLTLKNTKMTQSCPQLYKTITTNMKFDFMSKENPWYAFNCRIVRFKMTDDTYECIITNLDRNEFSADEIKNLYNKRWEIETAFRELKYAIGLNALHSQKRKLIKQEIHARVILYNFCQRIVQEIKNT